MKELPFSEEYIMELRRSGEGYNHRIADLMQFGNVQAAEIAELKERVESVESSAGFANSLVSTIGGVKASHKKLIDDHRERISLAEGRIEAQSRRLDRLEAAGEADLEVKPSIAKAARDFQEAAFRNGMPLSDEMKVVDAALTDALAGKSWHTYHAPCGTCAISNDEGEVCNSENTCYPPKWSGYKEKPKAPAPEVKPTKCDSCGWSNGEPQTSNGGHCNRVGTDEYNRDGGCWGYDKWKPKAENSPDFDHEYIEPPEEAENSPEKCETCGNKYCTLVGTEEVHPVCIGYQAPEKESPAPEPEVKPDIKDHPHYDKLSNRILKPNDGPGQFARAINVPGEQTRPAPSPEKGCETCGHGNPCNQAENGYECLAAIAIACRWNDGATKLTGQYLKWTPKESPAPAGEAFWLKVKIVKVHDDCVVVEGRGHNNPTFNVTVLAEDLKRVEPDGQHPPNSYCAHVCQMDKMYESEKIVKEKAEAENSALAKTLGIERHERKATEVALAEAKEWAKRWFM